MQIKLRSQRSDRALEYDFENEIITATMDGITDTFNFSQMPDGQAKVEAIETILPVIPVISAKREEGQLFVELLNFIGIEATEEERFPQWQEV